MGNKIKSKIELINKKFDRMHRFRFFMFSYWAMMVSFAGMYTMYITKIGFAKSQVSVAVTVYILSALIGQITIGYLVDRLKRIREILMISLSFAVVIGVLLPLAKYHWQIVILVGMWGFFIYGSFPLSEAWCIETLKKTKEQRNFGKIRGFGSIGYGLSAILIGVILQNIGWKAYPAYIVITAIITLFSVSLNENISFDSRKKAVGSDISFKEALKEIIKIRPLFSMVMIIFSYNFVLKGIYSYLGVLLTEFGGGPLSLGFTYFFDSSPELITFFLSSRLMKKFDHKKLIMVAFILQVIRLTFILIFNNAMAVILLGSLSGFAFGLLATSYKTYIFELSPEKYKAMSVSISESIVGFSSVLSAPVFGLLFTAFGTRITIFIGLIIYIAVLSFLINGFRKKQSAVAA